MIYKAGMSMYDMAMTALMNEDGWMFAYCCDHMTDTEREQAERLKAAKIQADLAACPF